MKHELKVKPENYEAISSGKKKFEIRRNDQNYQVGDILCLKEWYRGRYTGRSLEKVVDYIYEGNGTHGISEKCCIMSLRD